MRDKLTVKTLWLLEAGVIGLALGAGAGCSSTSKTTGNVSSLPADVQAITFLQRVPHNDTGNVFDYQAFHAGGRLSMLSPPSADGQLTVIFPTAATCTAILQNMDGTPPAQADVDSCVSGSDVQAYDLSFDAKSVVFSAQLPGDGTFQIYLDQPGRHEPAAADQRRERLRLSSLRAGRSRHLHDQPERRGRQRRLAAVQGRV